MGHRHVCELRAWRSLPSGLCTPLEGQRALLTVNFESISPRPWAAAYGEVMGRALPFEALRKLLAERAAALMPWTSQPARPPVLR